MADAARFKRLSIVCCVVISILLMQPTAAAPNKTEKWSVAATEEINSMLTSHLQRMLSNGSGANRQINGSARVQVEPATGTMVIYLSKSFLPENDPVENEDFEDNISTELMYLVQDIFTVRAIEFLYGGRSILDYFEPRPQPDYKLKPRIPNQSVLSGDLPPLVRLFLATGHGYGDLHMVTLRLKPLLQGQAREESRRFIDRQMP